MKQKKAFRRAFLEALEAYNADDASFGVDVYVGNKFCGTVVGDGLRSPKTTYMHKCLRDLCRPFRTVMMCASEYRRATINDIKNARRRGYKVKLP